MKFTNTALVIALASGCSASPHRGDSDTALQNIAASQSGTNVALIFYAANGLPGADQDINALKEFLNDKDGGNNFKVVTVVDATKRDIIDTTKRAAQDVGEQGTLVWYFGGHGTEEGLLYTADKGFLNFDEVSTAIKGVRQTPIKRLFVLIDSCFSGQMVDGNIAIGRDQVAPTGADSYGRGETRALSNLASTTLGGVTRATAPQTYGSVLFEQLFVMAAARKTETAAATDRGSTFTTSVLDAFKALKGDKAATLRDYAEKVKQMTVAKANGSHTPVYRAVPESAVLTDLMTGSTGPMPPPAAVDSDLYAMFGPAPQSLFYVAGNTRVASVTLCRGEQAACITSRVVDTSFTVAAANLARPAGRTVFQSVAQLSPIAQQAYTLLGFDHSGALISARGLSFTAK